MKYLLSIFGIILYFTGSVASAGVTKFTNRKSFEQAAGKTVLIKFDMDDAGNPITTPSNDKSFASLEISGAIFRDVRSYWNLAVYTGPNAVIRVDLPSGTKVAGTDLSPFYNIPGTYTIKLSTGEVYTHAAVGTASTPDFFGVISTKAFNWISFSLNSTSLYMDNFNFLSHCLSPLKGTIGWWPLDEISGQNAADLSGNKNHAQWIGSPTPTPAKVFGGLQFDGVTHQLLIPNTPTLNVGTGNLSIALWLKLNQASFGTIHLLGKRSINPVNGYELYLWNGKPGLQLSTPNGNYDNFSSTGQILADGKMHFLVVTLDRKKADGLLFYIDGIQVGIPMNPTAFSDSLNSKGSFTVAKSEKNIGGSPYQGMFDEIMLLSRVLSQKEITAIYTARQGVCR